MKVTTLKLSKKDKINLIKEVIKDINKRSLTEIDKDMRLYYKSSLSYLKDNLKKEKSK